MALFDMTVRFVALAVAAAAVFVAPGCDEPADDRFAKVTLSGRTFDLELALDDEKRFVGLSGRESIPADGGMLFVFPDNKVRASAFVMRDCPVDIDIIFLDRSARIIAMHAMKAEPPRTEDEKQLDSTGTNPKYEARLKKYPSAFPTQYVIELKGGTLAELNPPLKTGQKIKLDETGLKKRAR